MSKFYQEDWQDLDKTENYFINQYNRKIHVRLHITEETEQYLFQIHGLYSHCNTKIYQKFADRLATLKIGLVMFDNTSHGYSDWENDSWGQFSNGDELVSNCVELIDIVLGHCVSDSLHITQRNLPFFLAGHSMGGGIASVVANQLVAVGNEEYNILGSIFLAPMFDAEKPDSYSLSMLKVVGSCIPMTVIPSFINEDKGDPKFETTLIEERNYYERVSKFKITKPFEFAVGISLIRIIEMIQDSSVSQIPFLIIIDPEDLITKFKACQAQQNESDVIIKELYQAKGLMHNVWLNDHELVISKSYEFLKQVITNSKNQQF